MALNGCKEDKSALEQLRDDYLNDLESVMKSTETSSIIADHNQRGSCQAHITSEQCFNLIKNTYSEYEGLKLLTSSIDSSINELNSDFIELQDNLKSGLNSQLQTSIASLKQLSQQIKSVKSAMCTVENEISDNCNSKQLSILTSTNNIDGKEVRRINAKGSNCWDDESNSSVDVEDVGFLDWIEKISNNTNSLTMDISKIMDISIHAASMNARLSFEGLKIVGAELVTNSGGLSGNSKTCFDALKEDYKVACENLLATQTEKNVAILAEDAELTKTAGLTAFKNYVTNILASSECGPWLEGMLRNSIQQYTSCAVGVGLDPDDENSPSPIQEVED